MQIEININGKTHTRDLALLPRAERNALARLLALGTMADELFVTLQGRPKYKTIKPGEVLAKCPAKAWFRVEFQTENLESDKNSDLTYTLKQHTGSGYCKACDKVHSVTRRGLLVSTAVEGVPFSKELEVTR